MIPGFNTFTFFMLWTAGKVNIRLNVPYAHQLCHAKCRSEANVHKIDTTIIEVTLQICGSCSFCMCSRRLSVRADHPVAPLHLQSSQRLCRNDLLPEWHQLWLSVLVPTAEWKELSVNSVYSRWLFKLWSRIQVWFSVGEVQWEAMVSDSNRPSGESRGCLSVCCQSTQCCGRPQACDKNIKHRGCLLLSHLNHIKTEKYEGSQPHWGDHIRDSNHRSYVIISNGEGRKNIRKYIR